MVVLILEVEDQVAAVDVGIPISRAQYTAIRSLEVLRRNGRTRIKDLRRFRRTHNDHHQDLTSIQISLGKDNMGTPTLPQLTLNRMMGQLETKLDTSANSTR